LEPSEPRDPLSAGIMWASRATSLGLEFVLPTLVGLWLDGRFGTKPWGTLVGALLGFAAGMTHLLRIAKRR
jgi:F0F1-type ATP synthase assembly protein I